MNRQQEQLETLHEIRNIMDRSSRFISLSGLSGISAGVTALAGAGIVKWYSVEHRLFPQHNFIKAIGTQATLFVVGIALAVLVTALGLVTYFTMRRARNTNQPTWNSRSQRLVINLALPLAAGGIFCSILFYHTFYLLIAPAMLVFYGLALINGSKYTLSEIRNLGLCEIVLGLLSGFYVQFGLLAWAIGFGVLHIVYGALVYFKYERTTTGEALS